MAIPGFGSSSDKFDEVMLSHAALFAANYLAAMEMSGFASGIEPRALAVMDGWHSCRIFLEKVKRGEDVVLYQKMLDMNAALKRKAEEQHRRDTEAADANLAKARAAFGEKVTA